MEISEGMYTLAGVVLGALLTALLTQASTWLGIRQADQRTKREAVYFLLELRRLLSVLARWNRLIPQFLSRVRGLIPELTPDLDAALDKQLEDWLRAMPAPVIGPQLAALKAGYEAGLLKLAAIDPVGAYRLRGMDELLERLPQMLQTVHTTSAAQLGITLPDPAEMTEIATFFRQHLEVDSIAEAFTLVHSVVEELVGELDRRTQQRWKEELAREFRQETQALAKLDNYLEKVRAMF
jgi:hypothetical protein